MKGSGIVAMASDTRASEGGCMGPFNRVLKCSYHLAAIDVMSDNSFPLRSFSRADEVAHFCLSYRKAAKASLISPVLATCSIHCCLSYLSDLLRGPVRCL